MSDATISFYARGGTRYATGRIVEWGKDGRVEIETDDGKRLTGLRVPDYLGALAEPQRSVPA